VVGGATGDRSDARAEDGWGALSGVSVGGLEGIARKGLKLENAFALLTRPLLD
jgi:hypothetical protein